MNSHERLKTFIETRLLSGSKETALGFNDDLLLSGLINSLDVMRLVTFTAEEFKIEIPPEDVVIENFQSIDAIVNYVHSRQ
ncbi:MAG: acyl carrier protein [Anaerolineae bacterium]|nr:acyl carrier protein [Anaerolineae bacterium]